MTNNSLQQNLWSFQKKHKLYWMLVENYGDITTSKQEPTQMLRTVRLCTKNIPSPSSLGLDGEALRFGRERN